MSKRRPAGSEDSAALESAESSAARPSHIFSVLGPDGRPMSLSDLPASDTTRWVIRRKAQVLAAINGGLITVEEACHRYHLTVEELHSWQRMVEKHGIHGLRVTRLQKYRKNRGNPDIDRRN